jgi:hypothetical protein
MQQARTVDARLGPLIFLPIAELSANAGAGIAHLELSRKARG